MRAAGTASTATHYPRPTESVDWQAALQLQLQLRLATAATAATAAAAADCSSAASRCCDWQSHQIVTIFHLSSGAVHDYYYISGKS